MVWGPSHWSWNFAQYSSFVCTVPVPLCPVCPGPVCPGPVCPGPVCPGPVCPGPVCPGPVCPGPVCPGAREAEKTTNIKWEFTYGTPCIFLSCFCNFCIL